MKIAESVLWDKLNKDFGGVLKAGKHGYEDGACCILELGCAVKSCAPGELSDSPEKVGCVDLRPINDAAWSSDALRAKHMIPLYHAYSDWSEWIKERQVQVMQSVALRTVTHLLPKILRMIKLEKEAVACESAKDLDAARAAAGAAEAAAGDEILIFVCQMWIDCAGAETKEGN